MNARPTPAQRLILEPELEHGEVLQWCGQPAPDTLVGSKWLLGILGLFLALGGLVWFIASPGDLGAGSPMAIFFGVALMLMLTPVWDRWTEKRTVYAVTNRRALVVSAPWQRTVFAFSASQAAAAQAQQADDGQTNLVFHRQVSQGKGGTRYSDVGFLGITEGDAALALVHQLAQEDRAGAEAIPAQSASGEATALNPPVDAACAAAVAPHLKPGEHLLWCQRPHPGMVVLHRMHHWLGLLFMVTLLSLFVFDVALAWATSVVPAPLLQGWQKVGLSFEGLLTALQTSVVLFALYFPVRAWLQARKTVYAITDQRALEVEQALLPWRSPQAAATARCCTVLLIDAQMANLHRVENRLGVGWLVLHRVASVKQATDVLYEEVFLGTPQPRVAHALLARLAQAQRLSTTPS